MGSAITIDLQSHSIDRGLDQSDSSAIGAGFVLKVASGASVTITGSTTRGEIKGGNNTGFGGGIVVEGGGKLTLGNVHIGGNKALTGKGVGVYLATGAALTLDGLVMMGGDIYNTDGYSDIFLNGGKITLGNNFQSGSKVYVSCAVGATIFSTKTTAEKAKGIYAYKSDEPNVRLAYDIYRNAFYLPGKVTQAPTAIAGLTYNKADQTLINAGTASGGAIYYKKTDKNASKPEFINASGNVAEGWVSDASSIKGKDPGTYRVWYAVKGDDRYCTVDPAYVDVEIAKANMSITTSYNVSIVAREAAQHELTLDALEDGFIYKINNYVSGMFDVCTVKNNKLTFVANHWEINTSQKIVIGVVENSFYNTPRVEITVTADTKNDQSFCFRESSIEKEFGAEPFINQITNHAIGTVTYSSSNESVATVDTKGKVTIKGVGETTITAEASGNENYNPKTISYTLRVTKGKPVISPLEGSTNLTFSPTATGSAIGYEQPLLEKAGIVSGGAIYYAVTDANATAAPAFDADNIDTNVWSSDIPMRSNAGTYKVWYAVKGDQNHMDIVANIPVEVTIAKARHPYYGVSSSPLVVLSNSPQTNVIRLTEDDITRDFKYVETSLTDHNADNSIGLVDSAEIIVGEDGRQWVTIKTLGDSELCTRSYHLFSKVAVLINAGDNYEEFWGYLPVIAGAIKFEGVDVSVEYGNNNNTYT
ncbi:MAG: Ig-like domain-containing protein [Lachnospiraceae bacterium]|nr:Ig-like domain-containing protein [Lachnospiraceae bacterium]